ncbi:MAG: WcaI family glycosyltransferase [Opitutaceae bacterium]
MSPSTPPDFPRPRPPVDGPSSPGRPGKLKILLWGINYAPEPTGIAPFNHDLCRHLAAEGHTVTAVTAFAYYPYWRKSAADTGRWRRTEVSDGVTVERCWCYVPRTAGVVRRMVHELSFGVASWWRVLRLPRADIYVVVSPPLVLGFFAWIATRLKRSRFVFHVQDLQPDAALGLGMLRPGMLGRALYWLEGLAYAKAARVSGISPGMMAAFAQKKVPAEKCVLLPNWLHTEPGNPATAAVRDEARRQFDVPPDALLAVYAGNLGMKQGLEIIVLAAECLAAASPAGAPVKIIIAGDGAARAGLEQRLAVAGDLGLTLLPLLADADYKKLLAAADVALITQAAGTGRFFFPSKLLSVLSARLPVVAVADESSELAHAIEEGGFGCVVAPGDAGALAAVLRDLASSREKLLGWQERTSWVRKFMPGHLLAEFEKMLCAAAGMSQLAGTPGGKRPLEDHHEPDRDNHLGQYRVFPDSTVLAALDPSCETAVDVASAPMTPAVPNPISDPLRRNPDWHRWAPTAVLLGLFWLLIFNQQRLEWSVNVVYAYGWAIPFLTLYLLWERWRVRPAPGAPLARWPLLAAGALCLAVYLPVRVIQEANPDWVKINWMMAGLCAALTLLAFAAAGGFRYARYFAFPIVFCFTALPWPVWMETALVQNLMRGNASVCAETLTWGGIPALATGNIIQVADHLVNVEEACSGIRSLQTAFMMSLFLGELYRLSLLRRLGLMVAAFGVAFFINLLRTLLLTALTARGKDMDSWHDPVGVVAMVLCLAALWGVAEIFRRRQPAPAPATPVPSTSPGWAMFPLGFAIVGCVWLLASEGMTRLWYSSHESRVPPAMAWHVAWPETAPAFQRGKFAERTLALLKFDEGVTASWDVDGVYPWQMYELSWNPGRVSKFLSSSHYPTVCLPATGLKQVADLGRWNCVVNGLHIPFATYLFDQGGRDVYVFHAIIEDRPTRLDQPAFYRQVGSTERLASVWHGERNLGQHVLGIALVGAATPDEARTIVLRQLSAIIRTDGRSSPPVARNSP